MEIFTQDQLLVLKLCGVIIVTGLIILGAIRWILRADAPDSQQQLIEVIGQNRLQPVIDASELHQLLRKLQAFEAVTGPVETIDNAVMRTETSARLWLIE